MDGLKTSNNREPKGIESHGRNNALEAQDNFRRAMLTCFSESSLLQIVGSTPRPFFSHRLAGRNYLVSRSDSGPLVLPPPVTSHNLVASNILCTLELRKSLALTAAPVAIAQTSDSRANGVLPDGLDADQCRGPAR